MGNLVWMFLLTLGSMLYCIHRLKSLAFGLTLGYLLGSTFHFILINFVLPWPLDIRLIHQMLLFFPGSLVT